MKRTTENDTFAREGFFLIFIAVVLTIAGFSLHWILGSLFSLWLAFCLYFFRNPKRAPNPNDKNNIICPADGRVLSIGKVFEPDFLKKECTRITIFMSPFNVHVNRIPIAGKIVNTIYHKGKYLAAFDEKASEFNERSAVHLQTEKNEDIVFVQIAGWLARRIINYAQSGDAYKQGDIYGLIKFGSRMDVYLPDGYEVKVGLKDVVKAGETLLAEAQA